MLRSGISSEARNLGIEQRFLLASLVEVTYHAAERRGFGLHVICGLEQAQLLSLVLLVFDVATNQIRCYIVTT